MAGMEFASMRLVMAKPFIVPSLSEREGQNQKGRGAVDWHLGSLLWRVSSKCQAVGGERGKVLTQPKCRAQEHVFGEVPFTVSCDGWKTQHIVWKAIRRMATWSICSLNNSSAYNALDDLGSKTWVKRDNSFVFFSKSTIVHKLCIRLQVRYTKWTRSLPLCNLPSMNGIFENVRKWV